MLDELSIASELFAPCMALSDSALLHAYKVRLCFCSQTLTLSRQEKT